VLAWETVSCTAGGADCRFLFRGTAPLGRPEEEALSRGLFRRPVRTHSHEKACVGSLLQEALKLAHSYERPE